MSPGPAHYCSQETNFQDVYIVFKCTKSRVELIHSDPKIFPNLRCSARVFYLWMGTARLRRRETQWTWKCFSASPWSGCSPAGWRVHKRLQNAPSTAGDALPTSTDDACWLSGPSACLWEAQVREESLPKTTGVCLCVWVCLSIKLGIPVLKWGHLLVFTRLG